MSTSQHAFVCRLQTDPVKSEAEAYVVSEELEGCQSSRRSWANCISPPRLSGPSRVTTRRHRVEI
eukprot:6574251-Prorocentrum_lima.AAC.1